MDIKRDGWLAVVDSTTHPPRQSDDISPRLDRAIATVLVAAQTLTLTDNEKQALRFLIRDLAPLCDYDEGFGHVG